MFIKQTNNKLNINNSWGKYNKFTKVLIIRGIGYRAFYLVNDTFSLGLDHYEYLYSRYLLIRAGHTTDLYVGMDPSIEVKIKKKDRKLIVIGSDKSLVNAFVKSILNYRPPSVYTGRGVRLKGKKYLRKAGKKDKQKGRGF